MYAVFVEGLDDLESDIGEIPKRAARAAFRALNKTARDTRSLSARKIREQVAFPARYLSGADGRLNVTQKASANSLSATITGRQRATSLATFATNFRGGTKAVNRRLRSNRSGGMARLQIKPGGSRRTIGGAFAVNLKRGNEAGGNIGLAVRRSNGPPTTAYKPVKLSENVYLLYGPSVDQVFRTVREDVADDALDALENEFFRLMEADIK